MKTRNLLVFILLLALAALVYGCSSSSSDAPPVNEAHPDGWVLIHGAQANADLASCQTCHGTNFAGSGDAVSCYSCHASGPPFGLHPTWWDGDALHEHQHFSNTNDPDQRLSWTTCATAACHGPQLKGGSGSAPTCFSADYAGPDGVVNSCHATGPLPSHVAGAAYLNPDNHGADAKDVNNINESMGNYCINCHGRPTNTFDGGFVSDPDILNVPNSDCSVCHTAATSHPTNWVRANNPSRFHSTVSDVTIDQSCALCHNTLAPGPGAFAGAPSCFSASFTNANGVANSCHPTGPGGAPHAVPFTDPNLHGPVAKSNLIFCQECHGTPGGAGSNPTFNVPIGDLINGCEDCHAPGSAHPVETDLWTFNYDINSTRRTHFASGNVTTACALCHNVSAGDTGGNATACTACHTSPAAPAFELSCAVCHGLPPNGTADDTGSPTPVAHGAVSSVSLHNVCAICHGANNDGSGNLSPATADYKLFNANDPALNQGGDHLDGQIEMNGPTTVGAGYNEANFGCDIACHPNNAAHQLPNGSGLNVAYGNYGSGSAACDTCHGYAPDGTADIAPIPVSHMFDDGGVTLKNAHNECTVCHGMKDDGTGSPSPTGDYVVAVDHGTGSINMNGDTQYNSATLGCDLACHPNNATYQLPNSSGFTVVLGSYGSGGGSGACSACHDAGVGGAPIVVASVSSHASIYTCEDCHTAHGAGTVTVPNNAAAGIAYTSAGHNNGIALGSAAAPGATEAEICWNCHATFSKSEWGTNTDTNGTAPNYNFGTLNQSNWVNATWTSANFSYKTGTIASTHSADPNATSPGVDPVANIHCSYCHDVHNVGSAANGGFRNGYDNGGNPPYLMGAWMGNPYLEDGAPRSTNTYPGTVSRFGAVPRGSTAQGGLGGYQIDQNNSNPTNGWTLSGSAQLCTMCHGTDVDNMNQFGNPSTDWVGTNGHSNAVLGGTGSNAANIFSTTDRNPSGVTSGTSGAGNPSMAYMNALGSRGYGFRSTSGDPEGWNLNPGMNNDSSSRPYGFNYYTWGATVDAGTTDSAYHKFSCSKCHNPHASRLPRLMITNCLDTNHNTWDTSAGVQSIPAAGTPNLANSDTISTENGGVPLSNATSAQNCHRVGDVQYGNSTGAGWNNVTPWREF